MNMLIRRLDMTGLAVYRDGIPPRLLSQFIEAVNPVVNREHAPGKFEFIQFNTEIFTWIMGDPTILGIIRKFCGSHARLDNHFCFSYPGEGVSPNIHGGPYSENRSVYYQRQGSVLQTSNLKIGIPLQQQRALAYVPGSHASPLEFEPGEYHANTELIRPVLNGGDVVFFTDALVHGTTETKNRRQMLYYTFTPGHVCWSTYRQPEWYNLIPERMKIFFRPPGIVTIDPIDRMIDQRTPTFQ